MRLFRSQPNDTDVLVRTSIVARAAIDLLDYRRKSDAGWRIYDVNILGVWLVGKLQVAVCVGNANGSTG
jgi:phospholipid transport system substrate-binding protein